MTAPKLAPGVRVRITLGSAAGVEGVIQSKWGRLFGRGPNGVEQWLILSNDHVRKRVMRADHLEVIV